MGESSEKELLFKNPDPKLLSFLTLLAQPYILSDA